MNFDDIQQTWRSPHNAPSAAQIENDKMKFITDLRRRRRSSLGLICLVFIPLAFFTGKIVSHVLWPNPALDPVDLSREWGIIPFFALPWIGWMVLIYLHRRHEARHANYDRSIHASVAALLDENRTERVRYRLIAWLLITSVVLLALVVHQLRVVGKAGNEILIPALVIYPAYVVGMLVWFGFLHRRKLLPRKRELETLLQSYQ